MKKVIISCFAAMILLVVFSAIPARAVSVLVDDFDNGALDSSWSVSFQNSTGWSSLESGTSLNVTDITPTVVNTGSGGTWAEIILSQSFTPLSDFDLDLNFSWDSEGSLQAMQSVMVSLYDTDNNIIASAGYTDAWVSDIGEKQAVVGGSNFFSGNTLPLTGSASVDISRAGSNIDVLWNGLTLLSGTSGNALGGIDLEFGYYAYTGGPSFFGNESVDFISVEGTVVPEPSTMILLGGGLMGLVAFRKKFKRS